MSDIQYGDGNHAAFYMEQAKEQGKTVLLMSVNGQRLDFKVESICQGVSTVFVNIGNGIEIRFSNSHDTVVTYMIIY